ncbi:uncharacterized protein BX664DRAFT_311799 [Halteromyces radiatus]|uniref:uncharacterized protein n=1 Tax=Halteromyces radiatus TaxID=101107 RepID=UPI00221FBF84|nr:uncharacterized protein BX664DRAFT_311799 [Halteromyces radiatus]KAI8096900.1 hypothetical protein BX664DRAFT_311799 [Halteromyces radiatus]
MSTVNEDGLESRILRAATTNTELPDFPDDQSDLPSDFEYVPDEEEEVEEVEEMTETELLQYLDQQDNPLMVAQRLFYHELNTLNAQKHEHDWKLKCLTTKAIEDLYAHGWTQMDTLLDLEVVKGLRREADTMLSNGEFTAASEIKSNEEDPYRDTNARDDMIKWVDPENNNINPPYLQKVLDFISGSLHDDLASMIRLHGKTEYQLAYYHPKDAQYEKHRDALPTDNPDDTSQRRVTVILYLNPGFCGGDGGELKIFGNENAQGCLDSADREIHPLLGRVVIFLSGVVDHAVLPAKKERFALTAWMR